MHSKKMPVRQLQASLLADADSIKLADKLDKLSKWKRRQVKTLRQLWEAACLHAVTSAIALLPEVGHSQDARFERLVQQLAEAYHCRPRTARASPRTSSTGNTFGGIVIPARFAALVAIIYAAIKKPTHEYEERSRQIRHFFHYEAEHLKMQLGPEGQAIKEELLLGGTTQANAIEF